MSDYCKVNLHTDLKRDFSKKCANEFESQASILRRLIKEWTYSDHTIKLSFEDLQKLKK